MATLQLRGYSTPYTPPQYSVPLRLDTQDVQFNVVAGSASPPGNAVLFWFGSTDVVLLDVSSAIYYAPEDKVDFGRDSTQPDIPKPAPPPNTIRAWGLAARSANDALGIELGLVSGSAQARDCLARLRAADAIVVDRRRQFVWTATLQRDIQSRLAARSASEQPDAGHDLAWSSPPAKDRDARAPWQRAPRVADHRVQLDWNDPPAKDRGPIVLPWNSATTPARAGGWFTRPAVPVAGDNVSFTFGPDVPTVFLAGNSAAYTPPVAPVLLAGTAPVAPSFPVLSPPINFDWAPVFDPPGNAEAVDAYTRLAWAVGKRVDARHTLRWGRGEPTQHEVGTPWPVEPDPADPSIPRIPRMGVYVVSNSVSVIRLPDQTPIKILGVTASLDYTSWAWNVQITLGDAVGLTLLTPDSNGPKEVQITINGFVLTAIAESYQRQWSFGKLTWVVTGRSRSAWLAAPYAPTRSLVSSSLSAASQLALDELSGTGWTLDWQAQDWNIDAGQFSYQNLAPIDAISTLAAAVGGTVQPDPSTKNLVVSSRYPVSPSTWSTATPDAIVPSSVLTKLGMQWVPAVQYNAAYVTGGNQGVNVNATLNGTAGDNPIPSTIQDALITAVEAGTERARVELVSGGNKLQVTSEAFILDPVGVLLPGKLLEVDETTSWRGLIQATSIVAKVANAADVRQTLTIERRPA